MRATPLAVVTAMAALLGACASDSGVRSEGGDVFVLETGGLSGSRAVERGLTEARDFCAANGRQFVAQDSRVGSSLYQLQFRCVAPFGTARAGGVDPLLAAAATPTVPAVTEETPRRRRARRASPVAAADPAEAAPAVAPRPARRTRAARQDDAAYNSGAALAPLPASSALPSRFARPEPVQEEPQALPPVATTPLFNPRGASFPAPQAAATRRIPADNGPFTPLAPAPSGQPAAPLPQAAAQPVSATRAATSDALPPIQLAPPVAAGREAAPAAGRGAASSAAYGASVPSPQALPGASSALAPIASPLRPIPAAAPTANPNTPPTGFFTSPGR